MHLLYGSQGSGSAAIEAALHRCRLPFRLVRASSWEHDSAHADLLRVNPLGQIPTLVLPDGAVMTESAAILIHLGLTFPAGRLLPADPGVRAQALRGLVFIAANGYAAIGVIDHPERWTTARTGPARERLRSAARQRLHASWEIFADAFDGRPFLLDGDEPGALDILASVVSRWSGSRAHLKRQRPRFAATLARIDAHPSLAPVFDAHWSRSAR